MDKTKKKVIRYGSSFSIEERHEIIKEYLSGNYTKAAIWEKHTRQQDEHGNLLRWMRQLGYPCNERTPRITNFHPEAPFSMKTDQNESNPEELKRRIKELEKQLEMAILKAESYQIMIDIAEKELNIPIRKKSDAK